MWERRTSRGRHARRSRELWHSASETHHKACVVRPLRCHCPARPGDPVNFGREYWIARSSRAMTAVGNRESECARVVCGRHALIARRGAAGALVEPGAVFRHLRALRPRRMPLARRCLGTVVRPTPPQLDAVVHVVSHLDIRDAVARVFEGLSAAKMTRRGAPFQGATGEGNTASSAASSQLPNGVSAREAMTEKRKTTAAPATSESAVTVRFG